MPCGWKCGAAFTGHEMRAHFSRCPKRAGVSSDAERRSRRGRPVGHRMPCGWGCGLRVSASEMRTRFTDCLKRPDRQGWTPTSVREMKRHDGSLGLPRYFCPKAPPKLKKRQPDCVEGGAAGWMIQRVSSRGSPNTPKTLPCGDGSRQSGSESGKMRQVDADQPNFGMARFAPGARAATRASFVANEPGLPESSRHLLR